ncbi:MAG TPA: MmgE/PrpD family protein [Terriglobales bacterium]|nr:MmgE/PrpD family protein [Terriglobales bacterium]
MEEKKDKTGNGGAFGRRDLMKFGVVSGVAAAITPALSLAAQPNPPQAGGSAASENTEPTGGLQRVPVVQQWPEIAESMEVVTSTTAGYNVFTSAGWKNTSGRHGGNGPVDESTRRLVEFTANFSESQMTPAVKTAVNYLMLDFLASLFSGYETDAGRAAARLSQRYPMTGDFKSTVFGYGITTTPEMAAFANGGMGRLTDFDDHNSCLVAGCLAVGEALHSTGAQVMQAIAIAYEIQRALVSTRSFDDPSHVQFDNWDLAPDVALAAGHLLGLNEDYLANALSLALVPHMPLYSRIGTQTNWKGFHSAEQGRNGVFAALIARDGMTGPSQPFEERDGLIAHLGPYTHDLRAPASPDGTLAIVSGHGQGRGGYKRYATEGTTQTFHGSILQPLRAWAKADEIAALELENTYYSWQEICDPPKWDPQNRETADHSFPYNIARGILDGYIYFDSFFRDKYTDPKVRELMAKITVRPNPTLGFNQVALKVRKKSGEERTFVAKPEPPFRNDEIEAKFKKSADFFKIKNSDQIMRTWMNLHDLKDIGEAMAVVAKFDGYAPRSLSDMSPSPNS